MNKSLFFYLIYKNKKIKNMKKSFIYLPILFTAIAAILYPTWIRDGYLGFHERELFYPTIASFVAIYGGLIMSCTWWYLNVWKKRND
jgi:hypothetical protein